MSVWFKYAGDKDITPGHPGGASVFKLPITVSFPAYGTLLNTLYTQEVPVSEGGSYMTFNSTNYPSQTATVDELADGSGGSFLDWGHRYDVAYKVYGVSMGSITTNSADIIIDGYNYGPGCSDTSDYYHDGIGGYYTDNHTGGCSSFGSYLGSGGAGENIVSTPIGNYSSDVWDSVNYYHDGSGGYYEERNYTFNATYGDYIGVDYTTGSSETEVPSGSGNYFSYEAWDYVTLYYDGSGGYYSTYNYTSQTYYGDFITNDGVYDYYWDGYGGYYY